MSKSESTSDRFQREYIKCSHIVLRILETFDNECPHTNKWRQSFFDPYSYFDWSIDFDNYCEAVVNEIREEKPTDLSWLQIKELIRLNKMIDKFDAILTKKEFPDDLDGMRSYMVNHPQWLRISRQAHKILELLKK